MLNIAAMLVYSRSAMLAVHETNAAAHDCLRRSLCYFSTVSFSLDCGVETRSLRGVRVMHCRVGAADLLTRVAILRWCDRSPISMNDPARMSCRAKRFTRSHAATATPSWIQ